MTSPRTSREVANQFIIEDGNRVVFQSYDSTIAEIDKTAKTITLFSAWDYSTTTAKYRNRFFDEHFAPLNNRASITKAIKEGKINNYKVNYCE